MMICKLTTKLLFQDIPSPAIFFRVERMQPFDAKKGNVIMRAVYNLYVTGKLEWLHPVGSLNPVHCRQFLFAAFGALISRRVVRTDHQYKRDTLRHERLHGRENGEPQAR